MKEIIYILTIISGINTTLFSQTFSKVIRFTSDDDRGFGIMVVPDGLIIPIEYWYSAPNAIGADQSFGILKIDFEGNEIRRLAYSISPEIISLNYTENMILDGDKLKFALISTENVSTDIQLWETNFDGDTLHKIEYKTDAMHDFNKCFIKGNDNNYLLFGPRQDTTQGSYFTEAYIIMIDSAGNKLQDKILASSATGAFPVNIVAIPSGYICTYEANFGRLHVAKLDNDLNTLWDKTYTWAYITNGSGFIVPLSDSVYAIAHVDEEQGQVDGWPEGDLFHWNSYPNYIATLDASGDTIWKHFFLSNFGYYRINKIYPAKNGDIIGIGYFSHTALWGLMVRMSPQGELLWMRRYKSDVPDSECSFFNITELDDGDLVLTGFMADSIPPGQTLATFWQDTWLVRVHGNGCFTDECSDADSVLTTAVQELIIDNRGMSNITVSPNPASSLLQFTLTVPSGKSQELLLYNAAGIEVRRGRIGVGSTTHTLDVAALPNGLYFWQIGLESGKLVIQH